MARAGDGASTRASPPATSSLRGRWLLLARMAWVALAVLIVGVFISGLPSEFMRLRTPCADAVSCVWVPRLTAHNARELGELGLSVNFFATYFVAIEVSFVAISSAVGVAIFGASLTTGWRSSSRSCFSRWERLSWFPTRCWICLSSGRFRQKW